MSRGIHLLLSVLALIQLARPFDCFAGIKPSQSATECCLKGNCGPKAESNECCRNSAPDAAQALLTKGFQYTPLLAVVLATPISFAIPNFSTDGSLDLLNKAPPFLSLSSQNLPLLI
jgi:hypothetical protein